MSQKVKNLAEEKRFFDRLINSILNEYKLQPRVIPTSNGKLLLEHRNKVIEITLINEDKALSTEIYYKDVLEVIAWMMTAVRHDIIEQIRDLEKLLEKQYQYYEKAIRELEESCIINKDVFLHEIEQLEKFVESINRLVDEVEQLSSLVYLLAYVEERIEEVISK